MHLMLQGQVEHPSQAVGQLTVARAKGWSRVAKKGPMLFLSCTPPLAGVGATGKVTRKTQLFYFFGGVLRPVGFSSLPSLEDVFFLLYGDHSFLALGLLISWSLTLLFWLGHWDQGLLATNAAGWNKLSFRCQSFWTCPW